MKLNSIVLKLVGTIMILFLLVLLPLGYITSQIFSNFYYSQIQEDLDDLSYKYANSIDTFESEKILSLFETLAILTNKEIYILDSKGNVVTNTGVKKLSISQDDKKKLLNGEPIRKKFIDTNTDTVLIGSGHPIFKYDEFKGTFFVLASIEGAVNSINKVNNLLILSGIGAFLLAIGFTLFASKKLSDPLLQMERATRQIAKGNFNIRLKAAVNDEIGSLGRAINDLAREIDQVQTNRREFFANISHELRTPISYVQGYSDVLKKGLYQSEAEKLQYLTIIENETNRMTRLINDLFELSKIEEKEFDLDLTTVNVQDIIEKILMKMELNLNKQLRFKTSFETNPPILIADKFRMEQIFINLFENAIRYTESGEISVQIKNNINNVAITIEDTGIGIPEKDLPYIFDRFHRVEKSRSRELGGTGLGLTIVNKLVELQKGTIDVRSEVGKGTVFELNFPISPQGESYEES